ncbi:MAG: BCCT family transporter [Pseudomonadota bacterium]|nr:BCCT family transporter [Pseudomonadota bacterium]
MEPPVFFGAAGLVIGFVVFGAGFTDTAASAFEAAQAWTTRTFGWWYMLAATGLLVLSIFLLFSPARHVRLGGRDATPDFSRLSWMAMLFAAGMGTGLVFWSVAEPLTHYMQARPGLESRTPQAAGEAMRLTFFHWGLNAWAIYIVLGLAIALLHFNRGLPLAPRNILEPVFGRAVMKGWAGHTVDILCTVGTLLGVSTSLGLGAMQINTGLERFLGWPVSLTVQSLLVGVITLLATISVVAGLSRGIRRLSRLNMIAALGLMAFVFAAGPTGRILESLVTSGGLYIQSLPRSTLFVDFVRENDWQADWTLFYWGWWISWAPFVAVFLARISRGRTVGEFIVGALIVPSLATFAWLAVFGTSGLDLALSGDTELARRIVEEPAIALHALLETLPLAPVSMALATGIILIFFVTSSDSGSFVDDMVTSGGDPDPPRAQRVFWAVSEGAVAITLLLAGGLSAIRNASIALGLPMSCILVLAAIALVRALGRQEGARRPRAGPPDASS